MSAPAPGILLSTTRIWKPVQSLAALTVVRVAVLALLFLAPIYFDLAHVIIDDPDIWWHMRTGQWIATHHALPTTDEFSQFGMGKPWAAYSWTFELLMYKLYAWFGLAGIFAYMMAMHAAILGATYWLLRTVAGDFWKAIALTAVAYFAFFDNLGPRPGLFTILFFIVQLGLLLRARRSGSFLPLLWLLPMYAFWANVHVQFVYGIFVLGVAAGEPVLRKLLRLGPDPDNRLPADRMWMVLIGCCFATLLNPYSYRVWSVIFGYMGQVGAYNFIDELRAPNFRSPTHFAAVFALAGAFYAYGRRQRHSIFTLLLLIAGMVIALRSLRDLWFGVVLAVAAIPSQATDAESSSWTLGRRNTAIAVAAVLLGTCAIGYLTKFSNEHLDYAVEAIFPVKAARYIREHNLPGPIYNDFNWGGYLIWSLPELPVSIDNRMNVHGDERIKRSTATWDSLPEWSFDKELANARLVIGHSNAALTGTLRMNPKYRVVYEDLRAVV
ncbi:MAG: hypothetical protein M1451_09900, partial [Acidobacteria bacterium]|nr:hypothetical protein [Acidobacteriota bacterium]